MTTPADVRKTLVEALQLDLVSPDTGEYLKTLEGHTSFVYSVTITPDGQSIVSGSGAIKIWGVPEC